MTVNKLTSPISQNDLINKTNEIIDNLGGGGATDVQINGTSITSGGVANIVTNTAYNASSNKIATMSDLPSGGANTDLSNLSATGEAHFLKSINSTDVINALGYTPENQANKVTSFSSSSTDTQYPSAKLLYDQLLLKQNTSTAVTHTANWAVGNSTTPVYINSSGVATSTGLSIASSRFDGQWVYSLSQLGTSTSTGNYTIDLNTYLPSIFGKYEVLLWCYNYNNNSSASNLRVWSDIITSVVSGSNNLCWLNASSNSRFQCTFITMPVTRYLYYNIEGHSSGDCRIVAMAYRRIGTNS